MCCSQYSRVILRLCLIVTRREIILAHLTRASSACVQRALPLPSVTSSNLGFAKLIIFPACLRFKEQSERAGRPGSSDSGG